MDDRERAPGGGAAVSERPAEAPPTAAPTPAWDEQPDEHWEPEAVPSLAAIGGHPLHPAVVPLPIGAFTLAFAADLAWAATRDRFYARAASSLLAAGIVTGLAAGALGSTDFIGRPQVREHGSAWLHGGGNITAIGLAALSLMLRRRRGSAHIVPGGLLASGAIAGLLAVTGWLGGELSYRHRIGVVPAEEA